MKLWYIRIYIYALLAWSNYTNVDIEKLEEGGSCALTTAYKFPITYNNTVKLPRHFISRQRENFN